MCIFSSLACGGTALMNTGEEEQRRRYLVLPEKGHFSPCVLTVAYIHNIRHSSLNTGFESTRFVSLFIYGL